MSIGLLDQLADAGLNVSRDGDHLIVAPRDRLTDELRDTIRQHKTELLAALNRPEKQNLDERIRTMARRWGFLADELAEALTSAQSEPQGWMAWTERDERDFGGCVTQQDFAKAYARARGLV